jgi:hypothetical protein
MVGRRAAVLAASAVFGAGVLAAVALADNNPPPGFQAAVQACSAQGLKQGTDAFAQCVSQQLGAPTPPAGALAKLEAAQSACSGQGLQQGTKPFAQCVQKQLDAGQPPAGSPVGPKPPTTTQTGTAPAPTGAAGKAAQQCIAQGLEPGSSDMNGCVQRLLLSPQQQKIYDACIAQGKTPGNGLGDCMSAATRRSSGPTLTPKQQDDVDYCLGLGKVQGTPEFVACIRTAGNRRLTPAQQASVDQCQKQGKTGQALVDCVGSLLTVKVPKPGGSGPAPAQVQAAFSACIAQKLKPPSDAFQACVTAKLKSP